MASLGHNELKGSILECPISEKIMTQNLWADNIGRMLETFPLTHQGMSHKWPLLELPSWYPIFNEITAAHLKIGHQ